MKTNIELLFNNLFNEFQLIFSIICFERYRFADISTMIGRTVIEGKAIYSFF